MGTYHSTARPVTQDRLALPRYRLVSRIATGGMAEVFLALMPVTCGSTKPVVIKRLWPELAQDPEHVQLFLDEARLTLSLNHPNVIHAYESGNDGSYPYLAMEYLDGQSFKHILDRVRGDGGLSLPLSLKIICDVLAGLEYVHGLTDLSGRALAIVHCDVSPQNVFVTCDGAVKLIDFGIAQCSLARSLIRPREIKGRVAYMAPEQLAGGIVDHRADLFSAGVMLWEAAVGRRLWQGLTDGEIMQRLLSNEEPPRLPRGGGFPPGLAAVCARALALDPDRRYATASEFQSDLAALSTGSMPAQTRLLGGLVSRVFASSRALSRTMLQQSLPEPNPSSSAGAATEDVSQSQEGALTSAESGTFPHSSSGSLAAMNDEVTRVGPLPSRQTRRRRTLGTAVTVSLLAGVSAYLLLSPSRVDIASLSHEEHLPTPVAPAAPLQQTSVPPKVEDNSPSPPVLPTPPEAARGEEKTRKTWTAKRSRAAIPRAPVTSGRVVLNKASDAFEVALPRAAVVSAARPIDREDPYRP